MTPPLQKTSRLFIAIPLPQFLKEALQECQEWLSSYPEMKVIKNWVETSKMHITLHFLGDVSHQKISQIQEIVNQIAKEFPLTLTMKDFGTFRNNELPHVLWVGIDKNEALANLHEKLAQKLEAIDLEIENSENYNPHVTLAYIRTNDEAKKAIKERLKKILVGEIGVWDSNEIELISSTQTQEGSVYKVIS
ncbi:2'-5' RNA ligase [Bernardetia litoralis DSM 6794]|uniref:RNA 2',3'-cyclic phosphodiesterase n=1 Tax=Bernardetia litoralis (strain ATCC 23117 / DSM 6794 / NBRC 15988 / NCIMB 1366 / Fx l1 / Sio-4) TaxID=880071 RepID=I4AK18_BERLS|nr:RNA 2',3'-cyclic phosphodiesterase [Bernardetia litoralis]AFM04303.1 2'-5' RNA ligase [Bernardetia litoralis DSM 6794]